MKKYLFVVIGLLIAQCSFSKESNAAKSEKKRIDNEAKKFEKDLKKRPDNAETYWYHANAISEFKLQVRDAKYFYEKALKIDSFNGYIYKDYGKYLLDKLYALDEAKSALDLAYIYLKNDAEITKYISKVNKDIEKREFDVQQKDFGHTSIREYDSTISYSVISNFDSLRQLTMDGSNKFSYGKLLHRFLTDDASLTPEEMYMLILGYSKQAEYNPFNYNDISTLKVLANYNADSAIKRGMELIMTNPLNPSLNREIMYCYRKTNRKEQADIYLKRIQQFFSGVLYSGNGSCTRPYISLWSKEEYNFINYIGYKQTDNHSMETCAGQMAEMIDMINSKTQEVEKINFNVKLIYLQTIGK